MRDKTSANRISRSARTQQLRQEYLWACVIGATAPAKDGQIADHRSQEAPIRIALAIEWGNCHVAFLR